MLLYTKLTIETTSTGLIFPSPFKSHHLVQLQGYVTVRTSGPSSGACIQAL